MQDLSLWCTGPLLQRMAFSLVVACGQAAGCVGSVDVSQVPERVDSAVRGMQTL